MCIIGCMNPIELSSQLRKPSGEAGKEIGKALNESNRGLYELAFKIMELQENERVLEIGFGNGIHFPQYFRLEPDLTVTGVDFSQDMCDEANAGNSDLIDSKKLSLLCEETSALPFSNNHFDLAVALNVIYFLDPPEPHLKEIGRVLKPGGRFLIGYRPRHSVEHLEFTKQNFILYETEELEVLLQNNGFEIQRKETNTYQKLSPDNTELTVTDACLIAKKMPRR